MFSADSTQVSSATTGTTLYLASQNQYGEMAQNTKTATGVLPPPTTLYPVSGIASTPPSSGNQSGFFITNDGTPYFAGYTQNGSSGTNTGATAISALTPAPGGPWVKGACGDYGAAMIKSDGTLWTTGRGTEGLTGQNNTTTIFVFTKVGTLTDWAEVAVGSLHMIAVKTNGTLWAWGWNSGGVFGSNTEGEYRSSPIQIGTLTNWSKVSASHDNSAAIKTDGTLWTWGTNGYGQIGDSSPAGTARSSPVQVGNLTNWTQVKANSCNNMFAINSNGALYTWGNAAHGGLGDNSVVDKSSPVQIRSSGVAYAYSQSQASSFGSGAFVGTDGSLWTWGDNQATSGYTLFDTTTVNRSSPVQVASSGFAPMSALLSRYTIGKQSAGGVWLIPKTDGTAVVISDSSASIDISNVSAFLTLGPSATWSTVSCGARNVYGIKGDGSLWAWGYGAFGTIGDNTIIARSSPVQVGALTNWSSVSGGYDHVLYTKTDGTAWACGNNSAGGLGDTTKVNRSSPVQIGTLTNWQQVSAGSNNAGGINFSAAIKTDGTLWTWGSNINGNLGDGTRTAKSSPIQVGTLTNWKQVSTNGPGGVYSGSTAAVKTDGTLWTWGLNVNGQLGIGVGGNATTATRSSPVQVGTLNNWAKVSMGNTGCAAIKTDGTLWTWGEGSSGNNGTGSLVDRSSPVQVGVATNWSDCVRTKDICVATQTDGSVWLWGNNVQYVYGQYTGILSTPVQIGNATSAGQSGWTQISANCVTNLLISALR